MTLGQEIVSAFREYHEVGDGLMHNRMLDALTAAIDGRCAILEENASNARAAMDIAHERALKAEALAAERLAGMLAAADFATILSKQLRLEQ